MKRETSAFQHEQKQTQQQQQQQQRDTNLIDRANELALDNLNVIYDNDTEHIDLGQPASPSPGGNNQLGAESKPAPATSGFVHGEHGDEIQEQQDNYATCLLEPGREPAPKSLAGRLNFWQPVQNRGVMHMIARLRYDRAAGESERERENADANATRTKRESFQTLIERVAPLTSQGEALGRGPKVHRVWLLDDCSGAASAGRKLLAELKAGALSASASVDIDAELVVGGFNLTDTNSILDKCLQLDAGAAGTLASCRVVSSQTLPPVSELDSATPAAGAGGPVQAVREQLLFAGSPARPTDGPSSSAGERGGC